MREIKEERIALINKEFDRWLGGFEKDVITTIYGPAGSGKTNLCLIATRNIIKKGKKVIYIDTEGSLSIERLRQLGLSDKEIKNIILFKVTNFYEQYKAIKRIKEIVKKDIGLIIVDSFVMLYRLELAEANLDKDSEKVKKINKFLASQLRILNEVARKKYIPIIITDQVYSLDGKISLVGGDILKYWSKCLIELQREENKRKAILRKHRNMPEKEIIFEIVNDGIRVLKNKK